MNAEEATQKIDKFNKKIVTGIVVLVVGLATLVVGVVFLVLVLNRQPAVHDAEKLTTGGSWQREDQPDVVWNFTGIGNGTLTTNSHKNDWEFRWALEEDRLLVETKWLYTLNDEFKYEIRDGKLVLNGEIVFVPAAVAGMPDDAGAVTETDNE